MLILKAVKKLFQIVQEKKPKSNNVKNQIETKRLEKEYKRLQLELNKERENYAQMHKGLNQEIQALKEELDKREQDIIKYKSMANFSLTNSTGRSAVVANHHHNHHHNNHHHASISSDTSSNGSTHNGGGGQQNMSILQSALNGAQSLLHPFHHHLLHGSASSPLNTSNMSSSYASSLNQFDDTSSGIVSGGDCEDRLESWLSVPNKRNIKKHGWKKLYVVLKKSKLFFYNSVREMKESQEPYMTIDLE